MTALKPIAAAGYLLYECTQGSAEWLQCRAGVVTASEFRKARTKVNGLTAQQQAYVNAVRSGRPTSEAMLIAGYKKPPTAEGVQRAIDGEKVGEWSDVALNYAFQKAIERISHVPLDENHQTWQMKRGHQMEPHARMAHENVLALRGGDLSAMMVMPAGFMTTPDGLFGCSVDGLVGDHGGAEYKCLVSAAKLRKVILFDDISDYIDQVQGCMWISARQWWHFGLYCPALKPVGLEFQMVEVQRDDDYIHALEKDLLEFSTIVDDYEERLRTLGAKAVAEAAEAVRRMLREEVSEDEPANEEAFA